LKTLRISDTAHRELTRLLGEMMAKTGKAQTYRDVIDELTTHSIVISTELLEKIDKVISANKQLNYATREKFVEAAIRNFLKNLSGKHNQKTV
jgi:hypothetical protein